MHLCRHLQPQRVEPDEAGGVVLVVGLGLHHVHAPHAVFAAEMVALGKEFNVFMANWRK